MKYIGAFPSITEKPIKTLKQVKYECIEHAYEYCQGNVLATARILDVAKETIYKHLRDKAEAKRKAAVKAASSPIPSGSQTLYPEEHTMLPAGAK